MKYLYSPPSGLDKTKAIKNYFNLNFNFNNYFNFLTPFIKNNFYTITLPRRQDLAISLQIMQPKGRGTVLKGDLYDWVVKWGLCITCTLVWLM